MYKYVLQGAAVGFAAQLVPLKKHVLKYATHTIWLGLATTSVHSLSPHSLAPFEHYLFFYSLYVPHYIRFPLNTEHGDVLGMHPAPLVTQPVKNVAH